MLGTILGEVPARDETNDRHCLSRDRGVGRVLEQLLAESTGKNGKALIPIDGESPAQPGTIVTIGVLSSCAQSSPDREQDRAVDALERAGER